MLIPNFSNRMSLYHALSSFLQCFERLYHGGDKNVRRVLCFTLSSSNWKRQLLCLKWFMTDTFIWFVWNESKENGKKITTEKLNYDSMQHFYALWTAWICLMTFSSTLLIRLCKGMPISVLRHLECLSKRPWKWMKIDLNLRLESYVHAGFWKRVKRGVVWEGYGWCDAEISEKITFFCGKLVYFFAENSLNIVWLKALKGFSPDC